DRAIYAELAVSQALGQYGVCVEVIVVDDGSTDDTAGRIRRIDDTRVRLSRKETAVGVAAARNRGIDLATTEWVAFLDDDDVWSPSKLQVQLQRARDAGAG